MADGHLDLRELLLSHGSEEQEVQDALERDLASADPVIFTQAVKLLHNYLSDGDEEVLSTRRSDLLQDSALTIVPLLIDHNAGPDADQHVEQLLNLIASTSRPRETYLAFTNALHQLREIEDRDDLSDEEEGAEDGVRLKSDESLAPLLCCSIRGLAISISRIQGTKCVPMLEPIPGVIRSVLGSTRSIQTVTAAQKVVEVTLGLASACYQWSRGKADHGDRSISLCLEILYGAMSRHGGPLSNGLLKIWFLDRFPRFAPLKDDSVAGHTVPKVLLDAAAFVRSLGVTDDSLLRQMAVQASSDPAGVVPAASSAFSALILLSTHLASGQPLALEFSQSSISSLMPILRNSLCGRAPGAALTLVWHLLDGADEGTLRLDDATDLVELVMPLAASMPDQTARLAAFKLLGAIMCCTSRGSEQIVLLHHMLAEDNPFEQVRVQCLGILRDEIVKAARLRPEEPSILRDDLLRALPLEPPEAMGEPAVDFLPSPAAAFLTDLLSTLRVLCERDVGNLTGFRSEAVRGALRSRLVDPALCCVGSMREELSAAVGLDPESAILDFLLERLRASAASLEQCINHA